MDSDSVPRGFTLVFCDIHEPFLQELRQAFQDVHDVSYVRQDVHKLSGLPRPSAYGFPGNSFGMMDGMDHTMRHMLSSPEGCIQERCQAEIMAQYSGEQPVGTCILVQTPVTNVFDWLAYAPSMRIPEDFTGTCNPYLAFRGLLNAVLKHNETSSEPIRSVVTTCMCTTNGMMSERVAAAQMRLAYFSIFDPHPLKWFDIIAFHQRLRQLM